MGNRMEKGTVSRRIFISNLCMVTVSLVLFLIINLMIIYCYSESVEQEVKAVIARTVDTDVLDGILKDYTIYRNNFILLFGIDGILCIAGLLIISQIFTRNLTEHISRPLYELSAGTRRVKENQLEEQIVYKGDKEFAELCDSFNDMMQALLQEQEKNRKYEKARTDMIAGISHDLRTPLTAVKGTIKALLDGVAAKPEQQRKFLETAYRRTGDMDILLRQLFYISKIETGNMPLESTKIEIAQFLEQYVSARAIDGREKGEVIECETQGVREEILADPEQLYRILDNILDNSRKYANVNPLVIRIRLSRERDVCSICIKDNGCGVPAEQLPHIFEEFYRADASRNQKDGNGLGLYIVKYLMEAMHGGVRADCEGGFCIYLDFPCSRKEQAYDGL